MDNFAVFIISHGRPNNVYTLQTLLKQEYTGKVFIVIDNEDKKINEYIKMHIGKVLQFNKQKYADSTDQGDNFNNLRTTTHARNACFDFAEKLGYKYFLVLDDDYTAFDYRLFIDFAIVKPVKTLDNLFKSIIEYYKSINALSICLAQGGDFIGGLDNGKDIYRFSLRKAMNTWFCCTDRKFKFVSRLNEDVNTYLTEGFRGNLFLTIPFASITQKQTQKTNGGMTDAYLDGGTYVKSLYTIMYGPSFTKINLLNSTHKRIHYTIDWNAAVPVIIDEKYKKH